MYCFFLIKNIYLIIFHYFEAKFIFNLVRDISSKLYKNYINQNYNLIIKESSSKFITKLSNEINQLQAFIISILILLSESLILFLIVLFLLYLYSFKIIFLLVAFFILIYIFFLLAYKKINKLGAGRKSLEILRIKNIQETSGGIKDIKILGFEKSFAQKYFSYANLISKFYYKYFTIQKIPRLYLETTIIFALSFLTYLLFKESNDANKVFTIMAVNFAIVIRLLPSINKLVNAFNSNKFAKFSALEILKLAAKKNNLKKFKKNH